MTREELLLATLASTTGEFTPVQIQKALFLLDKKAASLTGGPFFSFRPYDYGPFDQSIYKDLAVLRDAELVIISGDPTSKQRAYGLTPLGRARGASILAALPTQTSGYIAQLTDFVRGLGFAQLVSSIYKEFPDMQVKSVFRG